MWATILKTIVGAVPSWLESREKRKMQKEELKDAQHKRNLQLIENGETRTAAWETKQIDNSGWKDEWLTILLSIPLVGAFFPSMVPHITEGFQALANMPDWYKGAVAIMIAASFGYRKFADTKIGK